MRIFTILFCSLLGLPAAGQAARAPQTSPASAPQKQQFQIEITKKKPVARVGTREITIGEVIAAAKSFYPNIEEELNSSYGDWFLSSETMDEWIDAYLDLVVLARDERVTSVMPDFAAIDRAIRARVVEAHERAGRKIDPGAASRPNRELDLAVEQARRIHGFDAAREARLDELVPAMTQAADLRREFYKSPGMVGDRVRVRHLTVATRDEGQRRFEFARRDRIREDSERVAARLRTGENFSDVCAQVTGKPDLRAKETLPWLSFDVPLPVPILRAIFAAKEGEIVGPIETRDGYYIGRIEEVSKAPAEDFDKVAPRVQMIVRREEQYNLLLKLREKVQIVIY